jgi:glycine betaine catabolism B
VLRNGAKKRPRFSGTAVSKSTKKGDKLIMKAGLSVSLGLLFVGLATFNVITMLQSSRTAQTPRTRARAIDIHRVGGYLFIGLFAVMVWFMSKRLMGSQEAMAGDAALHIDLAILLAPLLFFKVMIARKYKSHHSILLPLGLAIYAISALLVFVRVLPYTLGKVNPSSSIVKYATLLLVLFCVFLVSLALRPAGSPASNSSRSSSRRLPPITKSQRDTFSLELIRSEVQTHDAKTLCFRIQEGKQLIAKPGQFLTFHLNIDGNQIVRCYSICSSPTKTDYVEITPKQTKNGYVSDFLNERAMPGLVINATGPAGQFYFDEKVHNDIVLIAAGSGITPMIAMLRYIEERAIDVPVTLIYCVRTSQDIIFERELTRLSRSLSRFRMITTLSAPDAGWRGNKGRLNKELLLERVRDFHAPTFFLCGPRPFMQHVSELLKEQGVSADRIKQESFGGKASLAVPDPSAGSSVPFVEFLRSGFQFELIPDMTLLEFAETVGVSIPYGCRQGQCGTCATRLLQGRVTMDAEDGLSAEQKRAGFILPCVSKIHGSICIDA